MNINHDIEALEQNIIKAKEFLTKYADAFAKYETESPYDQLTLGLSGLYIRLYGHTRHAAMLGDVFGCDGWTRTSSGPLHFDWKKEVDGVKITIFNAEANTMDGTAVPARLFPLLLVDRPEPSVEINV